MKRLLLIIMVFGFANLSQAQTKEETIAWIKEKLEMYGGKDNTGDSSIDHDVNVSPCKISFTEKYSDGTEVKRNFNPSHVKSWEVSSNKRYLIADAKIIQSFYPTNNKDNVETLSIKNGEPDIHERMIKALLHLATFCGKNETF